MLRLGKSCSVKLGEAGLEFGRAPSGEIGENWAPWCLDDGDGVGGGDGITGDAIEDGDDVGGGDDVDGDSGIDDDDDGENANSSSASCSSGSGRFGGNNLFNSLIINRSRCSDMPSSCVWLYAGCRG